MKTCIDGEKAVKLFKEKNQFKNLENIHLIICDQNMIIMNGNIACGHVIYFLIQITALIKQGY